MKGQFGSTLTFLVSMLFAVLALILVWSVMSKIFGVSTDILLGALGKSVCQTAGDKAGLAVGSVGALGGAAAGCGVGALVGGPPGCVIGGLIASIAGATGGYVAGSHC